MKEQNEEPAYRIGSVSVYGRVALAPMAGFSDEPYRLICRELGSALSYSEFVSSDALIRKSEKSLRILRYANIERPVIFQIFGNKLETLLDAALGIEELGPDIIDVNMGCSVAKVSGKGSGAGLLRTPLYAGKIIEALANKLRVPVTAKIRLGWDMKSKNYLELTKILEESGASMIAVHGRTKSQAYLERSDWSAISEIKAARKIPILGNGDIRSFDEAQKRIRESGADGVLIGRAAQGNPWIFSPPETHTSYDVSLTSIMRKHLTAMIDFYGEEQGITLFRKHAARYLRSFAGASTLRGKMVRAKNSQQMFSYIQEIQNPSFLHSLPAL